MVSLLLPNKNKPVYKKVIVINKLTSVNYLQMFFCNTSFFSSYGSTLIIYVKILYIDLFHKGPETDYGFKTFFMLFHLFELALQNGYHRNNFYKNKNSISNW